MIFHKKKGFTLIELLVVIAIITLLSAIVFTVLSSSKDKANTAAAMNIASGIMPYLAICSNEVNGAVLVPSYPIAGGGYICSTGNATWPPLTKNGYSYNVTAGNITNGIFDFTLTKDGQPTITCSLTKGSCQKETTNGSSIPIVTLTANPTSGPVNVVNPILTWTTMNSPTYCTAGGDWSGSANTTGGSQVMGILTMVKTYTYTLVCTNTAGNSNIATATVVVTAAPPTSFECSDGKDNDKDGFIDKEDPECYKGDDLKGEYLPDWDNEEKAPE